MKAQENIIMNTKKILNKMEDKDKQYLEALEKSRKNTVLKAVADLYENVKEEGLSTITVTINLNPYNIGYKINKTYTKI
jgi:ribosomal protein L23